MATEQGAAMRYVRTFWGTWDTFHAIRDGESTTLCGYKRVDLYHGRSERNQWATVSDSPEEAAFHKAGSRLCSRCARKMAAREGASA